MPSAAQAAMDDPETRDLFVEKWPKKCACGAPYEEHEWEKLRYVGVQKTGLPDFPDLELRNCGSCGSTMAIAVPGDFIL